MKQFIKLFSILVVLSLIAFVPSQAQTVTLNVTLVDGPTVTVDPVPADGNGVAVFTFNGGGYTSFTYEVVGGSTLVGKVIVVAPQAVPAHLAHGDVVKEVVGKGKVAIYHKPVVSGSTVTVVITPNTATGEVTVEVSGVTSDVVVNLTGYIVS